MIAKLIGLHVQIIGHIYNNSAFIVKVVDAGSNNKSLDMTLIIFCPAAVTTSFVVHLLLLYYIWIVQTNSFKSLTEGLLILIV
jgi:hypothetical protein